LTFASRYSDEQRRALELAWGDRAIRPAARIVELARAGELRDDRGELLEAFEPPESAVRSIGARYLRRRRARAARLVAPADALELLRGRLYAALELELEQLESEQRARAKGGRPPRVPIAERVRLCARATRELAAIPAAGAAPVAEQPRSHQSALASAILRAQSAGAAPALEPADRINDEQPAPELRAHELRVQAPADGASNV